MLHQIYLSKLSSSKILFFVQSIRKVKLRNFSVLRVNDYSLLLLKSLIMRLVEG